MTSITASEMARRSHKNRSPDDRKKSAQKAKQTLIEKFGEDYYKKIRAGDKFITPA